MIRKTALLAVLSAALLAPVLAVTPSTAATSAPSSRQSLSVAIASITPSVPRTATEVIKFTGTVRNDSGTDMTGLQVRLRYDAQKLPDRASMSTYLNDQTTATLPVNVSTRTSYMDLQPLASGSSARWEFQATPVQLGLREFGVYKIAVDIAQYGVPLQAQRTLLTYAPPTPQKLPRTKLAVALPVIDQPHRATDEPVFVDDKLSQAISGKGRLADLLAIAQSAPSSVTWFVEPSLLDDLAVMSKNYKVKTKDGEQDRPASAAAGQWLQAMRTALAASPVVAVPYADPDITALTHQGLDDQPGRAIRLGGQKAKELLGRDVKTTINWPAVGLLDADALDLLAVSDDKVDTVLLNSTNLPPRQQAQAQAPLTFTPDAAATLDTVNGPVTALVADTELSRLFEPQAGSSLLLSTQRFVAETAMIATEPGQVLPRSVVVAPSRRWDPNPALVTGLLDTAKRLPWLQLTSLESVKPGKASVPRAGLTYTDQDRREELSGKYLGPIKEAAAQAELTTLIKSTRTPSGFDAAVLRAASSAWRNNTRMGRAVTSAVSKEVTERVNRVQITGVGPDRPKTLAGSNGEVPISVKNSSGAEVKLYIDVKSADQKLLQIIPRKDRQELLTIGAGQSGTVQVSMNATPGTSGDATVIVQLKTADGKAYGEPQRLTIRTTGYTGIASVIVGAALTVMLAAVVTRVLRRRAERRRATAARNRESEAV
ncbi:DUF6049 family protein [Nonomuraea sp. NPDC050783]|uniref:DUF6049 family protein n=1 Tax=Nonomuraea sp. NPDC050783 TaxID=3154634 RepID=UPI00346535A6